LTGPTLIKWCDFFFTITVSFAGGVTITGRSSITVGVSTLVVVLVSRVSVSIGPLEVVTDEYVSALAAGAEKLVTAMAPNVKNNANFMDFLLEMILAPLSSVLDDWVKKVVPMALLGLKAQESTAQRIRES
jgi:hypothetical protein